MSKTKISNSLVSSLLATALYNADSISTGVWQPSTRYYDGARVKNGRRLYLALNTGSTGTTGPIHSSGTATDGTITWAFVMNTQPTTALGDTLHLGIGGRNEWIDEPQPNDVPENANVFNDVANSIVTMIRIGTRDMSLGVQRRPWVSGAVIAEWPSASSYAVVGQRIYRCISNNGGAASTVSPSGTDLINFELSDGYVWKFLGDFSAADDSSFGNADAFPISPLYSNDGSARWSVQQSAVDGSISGFALTSSTGALVNPVVSIVGDGSTATARADLNGNGTIKRVVSTNPGRNYTQAVAVVKSSAAAGTGAAINATLNASGAITALTIAAAGTGYTDAIALIEGDGTGAAIDLDVTSGYVTAANITNAGTGYTWMRVYVIAGTAGAIATAVLAPIGGHGRDIVKELPVEFLLVYRRITSLDSGYLPIGKFRQLSIITGIQNANPARLDFDDLLAGPAHPNKVGLDVASTRDCRVLMVSNIATVEHTADQDEKIQIAIRLV